MTGGWEAVGMANIHEGGWVRFADDTQLEVIRMRSTEGGPEVRFALLVEIVSIGPDGQPFEQRPMRLAMTRSQTESLREVLTRGLDP